VLTDGCGLISPLLMKEVWDKIVEHREEKERVDASPPDAIQLRIGGCKGVCVVDSSLPGKVIVCRPSMQKFKNSPHRIIEVNNFSHCREGQLNTQMIAVLSANGVGAFSASAFKSRNSIRSPSS
jgi:hypothetical protein